jgi:hypothetical protein
MAASPQHATLVANTVTTLTFDEDFDRVEVLNVDGAAEVYFRFGSTNPTVGGSVEAQPRLSRATVVKLISSGTPKVSVRGL